MSAMDAAYAGSIPALYDRNLAPLLFQPYAALVAKRALALCPQRLLEVAAGTGLVTAALHRALPDAEIIATDLNADMLAVAEQRIRRENVSFQAADALCLPFDDGCFDLVVCQFGLMFYPDKAKGNREARRVLREGGTYLAVIWDSIESNPVSAIVENSAAALHPHDPPRFLSRAPYGYWDKAEIERDLRAAGFAGVEIETVRLDSLPVSAADAAFGLINGCPLGAEIAERDPDGVDAAVCAVTEALAAIERDGALESRLSAHVVTATK